MANTAALLGTLLCTNADINYYTQQQIFWSNKYEANSKKLTDQMSHEEKWWDKYDKVMYGEEGKEYKYGGNIAYYNNEAQAKAYADYHVHQYDESLSLELAALDVEYDTMKCMYETLLESMRAQQESEKTATSTAAADTGLLNAG